MGFVSRDDPHPIVVLSGWSGVDERRDHSAILNARCVVGREDTLTRAFFFLFTRGYTEVTLFVVVRTMRDVAC